MILACLLTLSACGGGGGDVTPSDATAATAVSAPAAEAAASAASALSTAATAPVRPDAELAAVAAEAAASAPAAETAAPVEVIAVAAPAPAAAASTPAPSGSTAADWLLPARGIVLPATTPTESWASAANRVQTQAAWQSWIAGRRATVLAWSGQTRERADLIGGWMHDYVDPATGAPLTWTPQSPEPPAGSTETEAKFKRAWVAYLRDYNIRQLLEAARIHRATGDASLGEWAAAQLDFYATQYTKWPLRTTLGRARMFQNGLDEATASFSLIEAARLLEPTVPADRYERWRSQFFYPMSDNLRVSGSPLTNIGLWHAAAVARIGMRYGDEALVRWGLDGSLGTRATLASSLTADNLWSEGSFSYNAWVIDGLHQLTLAAALEGRAATVAPEREAMGRLLFAPMDYRFDNGSLPTPSDASPLNAIDARHQASLYRVLPTWWGVQRAAGQQTWDTLLEPAPALPAAPTLPAVGTRHFPSVRMAVLRAGDWQAFVHYGQAREAHAQQEALTFELHHGQRPISIDSGTVSYGSTLHTNWFTQGASHNVPLIDGQGQSGWAPGSVTEFISAPTARLRVQQAAYRPGVTAERTFELQAGGLAETTTLRAGDTLPRRLGVAFHTGCSVTPGTGLSLASGLTPPATTATAYWQGLVAYRAAAAFSVTLDCAGTRYTYSVQGPGTQTVFIGQAPTVPVPALRSLLYYETRGTSATFTARIAP